VAYARSADLRQARGLTGVSWWWLLGADRSLLGAGFSEAVVAEGWSDPAANGVRGGVTVGLRWLAGMRPASQPPGGGGCPPD
jgi:hypothetical protein